VSDPGLDPRIVAARLATGMLVVLVVGVAFLYSVVARGGLSPWLALVVALLGLGAGVSLFGQASMTTAAALLRRGRR
jgi:F0F1-type ATP synthase assembly protein I